VDGLDQRAVTQGASKDANAHLGLAMNYQLIAETVMVSHFLFVLFVVFGLLLIVAGGIRRWRWVRNKAFRIVHLGAILIVVLQSWLGMVCPLTHIENWARNAAGEQPYDGGFIAHWVERLLYFDAPGWVFGVAYTLFGAAVVAAWFMVPPKSRRAKKD